MATATLVTRIPQTRTARETTLGQKLLNWMVQSGENSAVAKAARAYVKLSRLSDDALAKQGLSREELKHYCFGKTINS